MKEHVHHTLSEVLLARPVRGRNLRGATLGDDLTQEPNLVVFLRHLG